MECTEVKREGQRRMSVETIAGKSLYLPYGGLMSVTLVLSFEIHHEHHYVEGICEHTANDLRAALPVHNETREGQHSATVQ